MTSVGLGAMRTAAPIRFPALHRPEPATVRSAAGRLHDELGEPITEKPDDSHPAPARTRAAAADPCSVSVWRAQDVTEYRPVVA